MKFVAKAKPVKIRITSGGQEHTSLESLKHNFNINDVKPLLDGRLSRWLRQQGDNELAESTEMLKPSDLDTSRGIMDLMALFFPEEVKGNKVKTELDLMKLWLKSKQYRKNGEHLFFYIEDNADEKRIMYLYKHKEELNLPKTEWIINLLHSTDYYSHSRRYIEDIQEGDPEAIYIIGKMLIDGYDCIESPDHLKNPSVGIGLIRKSAKLGFKEAETFILQYEKKDNNKKRNNKRNNKQEEVTKVVETVRYISDRNIRDFCNNMYILGFVAETNGYEYALYNSNVAKEMKSYDKTTVIGKVSLYILGLLHWWLNYYDESKSLFNESGFTFPNFKGHSLRGLSFRQQLAVIKDCLIDWYG